MNKPNKPLVNSVDSAQCGKVAPQGAQRVNHNRYTVPVITTTTTPFQTGLEDQRWEQEAEAMIAMQEHLAKLEFWQKKQRQAVLQQQKEAKTRHRQRTGCHQNGKPVSKDKQVRALKSLHERRVKAARKVALNNLTKTKRVWIKDLTKDGDVELEPGPPKRWGRKAYRKLAINITRNLPAMNNSRANCPTCGGTCVGECAVEKLCGSKEEAKALLHESDDDVIDVTGGEWPTAAEAQAVTVDSKATVITVDSKASCEGAVIIDDPTTAAPETPAVDVSDLGHAPLPPSYNDTIEYLIVNSPPEAAQMSFPAPPAPMGELYAKLTMKNAVMPKPKPGPALDLERVVLKANANCISTGLRDPEHPEISPVKPPHRIPLYGIHPDKHALNQCLHTIEPQESWWLDWFKGSKFYAANVLRIRYEIDDPALAKNIIPEKERRLLTNRMATLVDQPIEIGFIDVELPQAYESWWELKQWRDWIKGGQKKYTRTYIFVPHLVSMACAEIPLDTNLEAVKKNARPRLLRAGGMNLRDSFAAQAFAGSEFVTWAIAPGMNQLNSTVGALADNRVLHPQLSGKGSPGYPPDSPDATPKFTRWVTEPKKPSSLSPRPVPLQARLCEFLLKLAFGVAIIVACLADRFLVMVQSAATAIGPITNDALTLSGLLVICLTWTLIYGMSLAYSSMIGLCGMFLRSIRCCLRSGWHPLTTMNRVRMSCGRWRARSAGRSSDLQLQELRVL